MASGTAPESLLWCVTSGEVSPSAWALATASTHTWSSSCCCSFSLSCCFLISSWLMWCRIPAPSASPSTFTTVVVRSLSAERTAPHISASPSEVGSRTADDGGTNGQEALERLLPGFLRLGWNSTTCCFLTKKRTHRPGKPEQSARRAHATASPASQMGCGKAPGGGSNTWRSCSALAQFQPGFTHTIQSTASMRDRSLVGRPMASRMMAMVMMPPAGMPAAPTLEAVAVTLETVWRASLRQEEPRLQKIGP